jgi:lipid-A-disaccharide synthase
VKIAITCNGPGETAGWLRPLLRELYAIEPAAEVHVCYVPDDYATGAEPEFVRNLFPQAHVYDAKAYLRTILGRSIAGLPERVDVTLYLGGDLMHAARLHRKLGGKLATYRFTRRKYARFTERAFAIDAENAKGLIAAGIDAARVMVTGNLAIDGALTEVSAAPEAGAPADGILFMPGSRGYEVRHLVPFFFTAALAIRREDPNMPIAFGISPFTKIADVRAAIEAGGDARVFSKRGRLIETPDGPALGSLDRSQSFPILRNALSAASRARLTVATPGTKVIELAAIGAPVLSCTPTNAAELVTINGPLTYVNRIPFIGGPLKRLVATRISKRFRFHTQPNIDAGREIVRELHGTLTPGRVARVALELCSDKAWLAESSKALRSLYTEHVGAAGRMARGLLEVQG